MNQRKIAIPDLVFAAAGLLAIISTFLPWWSLSSGGFSVTVNGWNSASVGELSKTITGPLVWIPMLLLFVLGVLALIRAFAAPQLLPGKVFYQVGIGVGGLAALLVIVRWMTYWSPPGGGSSGASFGTYLGLLLGLAAAGVGVWALQQPQLTAVQGAQAGGGFGGYQQPGQYGGFPQQQYGQQQYGQPGQFAQPQYDPQQYGQPQQQPYAQQPQQAYEQQGQPQYGQAQPQQGYPQQPQQPQYAQPSQQQNHGQPQPQPGYPQQPQQQPQNYGQPPQFGQQPQQGQPPQPPASWQ